MIIDGTVLLCRSERSAKISRTEDFIFVGKIHTGALFVKKPAIFFENVKIIGLIILENVKIMVV